LRQKILVIASIFFFHVQKDYGQTNSLQHKASGRADTLPLPSLKVKERDIRDVVHDVFQPHKLQKLDSVEVKDTLKHYSFVPAFGYTLQTGLAAVLSANLGYYNDIHKNTKLSSITTNFTYSQYRQIIVPFQADIWSKENRFNYITDIRFLSYPSDIYGLGGKTDPNKGVTINFTALKVHQTVMKALSDNIYVGVGYFFDKFWNIKAVDQLTRRLNTIVTKELGTNETASGPAFRFLYDTRLNQINPQQGVYYSITYRANLKALGSDSNSNGLQIDARTYLNFPSKSKNVLAFWMFDWVVTNGTPPYLLLPSTGWDDFYNTGRGYIQGRFRGRKMLYFESEYRFGISRNGLLGGVAFVNLQNFSSDLSAQYSGLFPGYGAGIRIKLNKFTGTNLCIDYGFGQKGSHGLFVNLAEVF
jgi:hypothetical protein